MLTDERRSGQRRCTSIASRFSSYPAAGFNVLHDVFPPASLSALYDAGDKDQQPPGNQTRKAPDRLSDKGNLASRAAPQTVNADDKVEAATRAT
jgi:hypothetical protein